MVDPISIALGLSKLAPIIAGWFGGDDAESKATEVIEVAKRVTGLSDGKEALTHMEDNPELQIKFQEALNPIVIARLQAKTQQLITVNETMRTEYQSNDCFVRWWRPFFGYAVAISWAIQMIGFTILFIYVAVTDPTNLVAVVQQFALLTGALITLWTIALGVLGVNIHQRSRDKVVAAGYPPDKGVIRSLTERLLNKDKGAI